MGQVFISFTPGAAHRLEPLREVVAAAGHAAWPEPDAARPGDDRVADAIEQSFCALVLLTDDAVDDEVVRAETAHAQEAGVPLVILRPTSERAVTPTQSGLDAFWTEALETAQIVIVADETPPAAQASLRRALSRAHAQPDRCPILSLVNFKGGVGKTTLTALLARFVFQLSNANVLMVDIDPQENLSDVFLSPEDLARLGEEGRTSVGLFDHEAIIGYEARYRSPRPQELRLLAHTLIENDGRRFDLIRSHQSLMNLAAAADPSYSLAERSFEYALLTLRRYYDVIFIDANPSATVLSRAAARAADMILAPIIPDRAATRGLDLMRSSAQDFLHEPEFIEKLRVVINYARLHGVADMAFIRNVVEDPGRHFDGLDFIKGKVLWPPLPRSDRLFNIGRLRRDLVSPNGGPLLKSKFPTAVAELSAEIVRLVEEMAARATGDLGDPDPAEALEGGPEDRNGASGRAAE